MAHSIAWHAGGHDVLCYAMPCYAVHLLRDERRVLVGDRVDVGAQLVPARGAAVVGAARALAREREVGPRLGRAHRVREGLDRLLVQVGHGDARGEAAVVGVLRREEGGRLGGEVVELRGGHAVVHAEHHLLRHDDRVDVRRLEAVAQLLDARDDLVEGHRLAPSCEAEAARVKLAVAMTRAEHWRSRGKRGEAAAMRSEASGRCWAECWAR